MDIDALKTELIALLESHGLRTEVRGESVQNPYPGQFYRSGAIVAQGFNIEAVRIHYMLRDDKSEEE
jgi:hypothetical protein